MASLKATKKVVDLAIAKISASDGSLALATLLADTELLALVDDAEMLGDILSSRNGHEWIHQGSNLVGLALGSNFAGTAQYDLILVDSGAVPAAGTTLVITWAEAVADDTDTLGFSVEADATPVTISSAVTTGTTTTLTLGTTILTSQAVMASYDDLVGSVTDSTGRAVRSFTDIAITNNSTQV